MVADQSDSSTFTFDFSGINWSKDDPVSIVNAYREALKRQEQQKKRRLLENQIATNGYSLPYSRDSGSVESSATISRTIPSATESNRDQDNIANGGSDVQNHFANGSHEIDHSQPPSNTDSQVSEKRKRQASTSPEERRSGIKSALEALWNSRRVTSKLSRLQRNRRNIRKYAPPPYFAQLRRPGDKISAVGGTIYAGDNDQDNSSQSSTASVTIQGAVPGQAPSDNGSLPSTSTAGLSNIRVKSSSRPSYVDSITQTDTAIYRSTSDKKRRLDVSDITPERKRRPGFFSAVFEDSDEELKETEVEEPFLKKRRLFTHDGVTLASSPVFYRTRLVADGPDSNISPWKSRGIESDIAGRRLRLEQEEREQQQEEREECLKRAREEKEAELERQRKELDEERQRQVVKQKELEEKERQLKEELLKREQQGPQLTTDTPSWAGTGDKSAKAGIISGAISVPALLPSGVQTSTDTNNLATPSFSFGLPTSTANDKKASVTPSLPTFSVPSTVGTIDSAASTTATTTAETKSDQQTSTSSSAPAFQFGLKSSTDAVAAPLSGSSGLPFGSGSLAATFTSTSVSLPSTVATSDAASSAPSTGFSLGLTSGPSTAPTFSFPSKSVESTAVASTSASGTASTPALAFSFGKTSTPVSASTTSSASTVSSIPAFAVGNNTASTASTSASFGPSVTSASTTQGATAPSFSFGTSSTSSAGPLFGGFGATSSSTSTTGVSSAPSFTFTAGSTNTAMQINGSGGTSASAPVLGSTAAPSTPSQLSTPLFNFASSTANPASVFGFNNTSAAASPAPVAANGLTSSTPNVNNIFASPAPAGTPPPGRKLAPMRGRLRRR
ncbi:hypothetical protein V1525DRAFT_455001 [Lipomyces kononenkoae]|uniref:Uncharacterized protein n=1 Tax=Lipomyces kononenkoae TaxID=34357 RepID=A0ACC3T5W7_LIPKO